MLGRRLPDLELPSTGGGFVNPGKLAGTVIYMCYPYTGRPGVPDPAGWDQIAGAHGSTPQALAYSAALDAFGDARVYGVSFQSTDWQEDFVRRNALRFPLLSDARNTFSRALELETFQAGGAEFLRRITIIARDGEVVAARPEIGDPASDAAETLILLQQLP